MSSLGIPPSSLLPTRFRRVGNKLKGGIPKKLSKHKALKNPNLNENRHGGVMPPGRGGLNALEELNLGWIICKVDLLVVVIVMLILSAS